MHGAGEDLVKLHDICSPGCGQIWRRYREGVRLEGAICTCLRDVAGVWCLRGQSGRIMPRAKHPFGPVTVTCKWGRARMMGWLGMPDELTDELTGSSQGTYCTKDKVGHDSRAVTRQLQAGLQFQLVCGHVRRWVLRKRCGSGKAAGKEADLLYLRG